MDIVTIHMDFCRNPFRPKGKACFLSGRPTSFFCIYANAGFKHSRILREFLYGILWETNRFAV